MKIGHRCLLIWKLTGIVDSFSSVYCYLYIYLKLVYTNLIKTTCNNKNTDKNQASFLVPILLTNAPLTIPYSQYVELWAKTGN